MRPKRSLSHEPAEAPITEEETESACSEVKEEHVSESCAVKMEEGPPRKRRRDAVPVTISEEVKSEPPSPELIRPYKRQDDCNALDNLHVDWDAADDDAQPPSGHGPPDWFGEVPQFEGMHRPLTGLLRELQDEIESGVVAPQFQLILEPVPDFIVRRYRVVREQLPLDLPRRHDLVVNPGAFEKAVSFEVARAQLAAGNFVSCKILRIDRNVQLLKEFQEKLKNDYVENEKKETKELSIAWEPEWPGKVELTGRPCVIEGPPNWAESQLDVSLGGTATWIRHLLWGGSRRPRVEAILCGPRNRMKCNDAVPAVSGPQLKRLTKGRAVDLGTHDGLRLKPPVELCQGWTIDCWVKWPLRGLATDRVLVASEWDSAGTHIVWKRNIVGCEIPIEQLNSKADRRQHFALKETWNVNVKFLAAEMRDEENKLWTFNFDTLTDGWHRLTVVGCERGPERPMVFYLNGKTIGGVTNSPVAPVAAIGNRFRGACAVGNGIARFRIFGKMFSDAEVAEMCGVQNEMDVPMLMWGRNAEKTKWIFRE